MSKRWTAICALGTALVVGSAGIAGAYKPPIIKLVSPPIEVNGGFSPTRLPKSKLAPIHAKVEGTVNPAGDGRLPRLEQLIFETGKNVVVDAKGLPRCTIARLLMPEFSPPCQSTRIGEGELEVEVEFPETHPFTLKAHAIAFNGGIKGGTTIMIHAFLPSPVQTGIFIIAEASKVPGSPYGTRWTATIPTIAGGYGSVKKFQLTFFRRFAFKGEKRSYISAKCPNGRLGAGWEAKFADSASVYAGRFVRPCTGRN